MKFVNKNILTFIIASLLFSNCTLPQEQTAENISIKNQNELIVDSTLKLNGKTNFISNTFRGLSLDVLDLEKVIPTQKSLTTNYASYYAVQGENKTFYGICSKVDTIHGGAIYKIDSSGKFEIIHTLNQESQDSKDELFLFCLYASMDGKLYGIKTHLNTPNGSGAGKSIFEFDLKSGVFQTFYIDDLWVNISSNINIIHKDSNQLYISVSSFEKKYFYSFNIKTRHVEKLDIFNGTEFEKYALRSCVYDNKTKNVFFIFSTIFSSLEDIQNFKFATFSTTSNAITQVNTLDWKLEQPGFISNSILYKDCIYFGFDSDLFRINTQTSEIKKMVSLPFQINKLSIYNNQFLIMANDGLTQLTYWDLQTKKISGLKQIVTETATQMVSKMYE